MPKHVSIFAIAALFLPAVFGIAQPINGVREVPVIRTSPVSGSEMYAAYCAACHGTEGKGNGPAARVLTTHPTNLTNLARINGKKFPQDYVVTVLRFGMESSSHGAKNMPVWGPILRSLNTADAASEQQQRISNLTKYLGTLQQP